MNRSASPSELTRTGPRTDIVLSEPQHRVSESQEFGIVLRQEERLNSERGSWLYSVVAKRIDSSSQIVTQSLEQSVSVRSGKRRESEVTRRTVASSFLPQYRMRVSLGREGETEWTEITFPEGDWSQDPQNPDLIRSDLIHVRTNRSRVGETTKFSRAKSGGAAIGVRISEERKDNKGPVERDVWQGRSDDQQLVGESDYQPLDEMSAKRFASGDYGRARSEAEPHLRNLLASPAANQLIPEGIFNPAKLPDRLPSRDFIAAEVFGAVPPMTMAAYADGLERTGAVAHPTPQPQPTVEQPYEPTNGRAEAVVPILTLADLEVSLAAPDTSDVPETGQETAVSTTHPGELPASTIEADVNLNYIRDQLIAAHKYLSQLAVSETQNADLAGLVQGCQRAIENLGSVDPFRNQRAIVDARSALSEAVFRTSVSLETLSEEASQLRVRARDRRPGDPEIAQENDRLETQKGRLAPQQHHIDDALARLQTMEEANDDRIRELSAGGQKTLLVLGKKGANSRLGTREVRETAEQTRSRYGDVSDYVFDSFSPLSLLNKLDIDIRLVAVESEGAAKLKTDYLDFLKSLEKGDVKAIEKAYKLLTFFGNLTSVYIPDEDLKKYYDIIARTLNRYKPQNLPTGSAKGLFYYFKDNVPAINYGLLERTENGQTPLHLDFLEGPSKKFEAALDCLAGAQPAKVRGLLPFLKERRAGFQKVGITPDEDEFKLLNELIAYLEKETADPSYELLAEYFKRRAFIVEQHAKVPGEPAKKPSPYQADLARASQRYRTLAKDLKDSQDHSLILTALLAIDGRDEEPGYGVFEWHRASEFRVFLLRELTGSGTFEEFQKSLSEFLEREAVDQAQRVRAERESAFNSGNLAEWVKLVTPLYGLNANSSRLLLENARELWRRGKSGGWLEEDFLTDLRDQVAQKVTALASTQGRNWIYMSALNQKLKAPEKSSSPPTGLEDLNSLDAIRQMLYGRIASLDSLAQRDSAQERQRAEISNFLEFLDWYRP